jgi:hypothetical protein
LVAPTFLSKSTTDLRTPATTSFVFAPTPYRTSNRFAVSRNDDTRASTDTFSLTPFTKFSKKSFFGCSFPCFCFVDEEDEELDSARAESLLLDDAAFFSRAPPPFAFASSNFRNKSPFSKQSLVSTPYFITTRRKKKTKKKTKKREIIQGVSVLRERQQRTHRRKEERKPNALTKEIELYPHASKERKREREKEKKRKEKKRKNKRLIRWCSFRINANSDPKDGVFECIV